MFTDTDKLMKYKYKKTFNKTKRKRFNNIYLQRLFGVNEHRYSSCIVVENNRQVSSCRFIILLLTVPQLL